MNDEDVPSPIDLRTEADAKAWAESAEVARPWRSQLRATFAAELDRLPAGSSVLELGAGPGFLAERVLETCTNIERYTLLDFSEPMLNMARTRLARFDAADFVQRDFKSPGWNEGLGTYRAIVAMQAIHEIPEGFLSTVDFALHDGAGAA